MLVIASFTRGSDASLISQDVRLGANAEEKDGGKSKGFGSLWEYQVSQFKIFLKVD
jgi:hypothetical protein